MKILLVRHGETSHNREKIHQAPTTPLSDIGIEQANKIANRLHNQRIDKIYASPLTRALQTAEIIANRLQISVEIRKELKEKKRPSIIVGRKHSDPYAMEIKKIMFENYSNSHWHHSDEENFEDIKSRVVNFFSSLINENIDSTILLVTHGYVAKILLAYVLLGDHMTPQAFLYLYSQCEISNSGLSAMEYDKERGFRLLFWNDTTHY